MIDPESITPDMSAEAERRVQSGRISYDDAYRELGAKVILGDPRLDAIRGSSPTALPLAMDPEEVYTPIDAESAQKQIAAIRAGREALGPTTTIHPAARRAFEGGITSRYLRSRGEMPGKR